MPFTFCLELKVPHENHPGKDCKSIPVDLIGPEDFDFLRRRGRWYEKLTELMEPNLRREFTILAQMDSLASHLQPTYKERVKATIQEYFDHELSQRLPTEIQVKFE